MVAMSNLQASTALSAAREKNIDINRRTVSVDFAGGIRETPPVDVDGELTYGMDNRGNDFAVAVSKLVKTAEGSAVRSKSGLGESIQRSFYFGISFFEGVTGRIRARKIDTGGLVSAIILGSVGACVGAGLGLGISTANGVGFVVVIPVSSILGAATGAFGGWSMGDGWLNAIIPSSSPSPPSSSPSPVGNASTPAPTPASAPTPPPTPAPPMKQDQVIWYVIVSVVGAIVLFFICCMVYSMSTSDG